MAYDFYRMLGRQGYDRKNGTTILVNDFIEVNASSINSIIGRWIFVHNSKIKSFQTLAHEYTHAVIDSETSLNTQGIDGAIHEGYADVFSMLSQEYYNYEEGYDFNVDWIACPDSKNNKRYIYDPKQGSNPVIFLGDNYIDEDRDFESYEGGAHHNSTIVSNLCYRIFFSDKLSISVKNNIDLWYTSLIIGYGNSQKDFDCIYKNLVTSAMILGFSQEDIEIIKQEAKYSCNIKNIDINTANISEVRWTSNSTTEYGNIYGNITNINGKRISNARVYLYDVEQRFEHPKECFSDKKGDFKFENLYAGKYYLVVEKENFDTFKILIELGYDDYYDDNTAYFCKEYGDFKDAYCNIIMQYSQHGFKPNTMLDQCNLFINLYGFQYENCENLILKNESGEIVNESPSYKGILKFENISVGNYYLEYIKNGIVKFTKNIKIVENVLLYHESFVLKKEKKSVCFNIKSELSDYFMDNLNLSIYSGTNTEKDNLIFCGQIFSKEFIIELECGNYVATFNMKCHRHYTLCFEICEDGIILDNKEKKSEFFINFVMKPYVEDDEFIHAFIWRGEPPELYDDNIYLYYSTEKGVEYALKVDSFEQQIGRRVENIIDKYYSIFLFCISLPESIFDELYPNHENCLGIVKAYDGQTPIIFEFIYESDIGGEV